MLGTLYNLLLGLACAGLLALMGAGALRLTALAKESRLAAFAAHLYSLAGSVVAHVDAELRPQLQAALADGVLTAAEKARLKAEALRLLKEALGSDGLWKLATLKGLAGPAAETFLSGLLEQSLGAQRALAASGVKKVQLRAGDLLATRVVQGPP